jgi:hypothetical protein
MDKADSPIWNSLLPWRGNIRTDGKGKKRRFFKWDYTHNDIEVYNSRGEHLGSMDPLSGEMTKPPVPGRTTPL